MKIPDEFNNKNFKGIEIGYILGQRKVKYNTDIEGIVRYMANTYTVFINIYNKFLKLGACETIYEAKEIRAWGEDVFYKPIINEFLNLKETLDIEDIPTDNRIGNTEEQIINNYIVFLGKLTFDENSKFATKARSQIKEYNLLKAVTFLRDWHKTKHILIIEDIPLLNRLGKTKRDMINNYLSYLEETTPSKIYREIKRIDKKTEQRKQIESEKKRKKRTQDTIRYLNIQKQIELEKEKILPSHRFGELKVLYKLPEEESQGFKGEMYKCLCSCGNIIEVESSSLKKDTKSCGCLINGNFKGVPLKYILGYNRVRNDTGRIGVYINSERNTYSANIYLYDKNIILGYRPSLKKAKELRGWGENTFYKAIVEEYYSLRKNLKIEDIPIDKRNGELEEEIIGKYITFLGVMSQEEIAESIQNVRRIIKENFPENKTTL